MSLISTKEMLIKAQEEGYAVFRPSRKCRRYKKNNKAWM